MNTCTYLIVKTSVHNTEGGRVVAEYQDRQEAYKEAYRLQQAEDAIGSTTVLVKHLVVHVVDEVSRKGISSLVRAEDAPDARMPAVKSGTDAEVA